MPTNLILRVVSTQFLLMALLFLVTVAQAKLPQKSSHLKDLNCTAGQIAKFDGEQWVCASDDIRDAQELVDANDQVIGSVLGIARPDALLVQLTLDGYSFRALAYSGSIQTEGLTRISADIGAMVYIDDQCLGQPYAGYEFPIFIFETEPYAILTYYDLVEEENKYALVEVAASSAFPSPTYIRQSASPTTGCVPTFRTFPNVVTFDILIDDVRAVYPPPYRIAE